MDILRGKQVKSQTSWTWLSQRNLKRENESLLIAAQINSMRNNNVKAKVD